MSVHHHHSFHRDSFYRNDPFHHHDPCRHYGPCHHHDPLQHRGSRRDDDRVPPLVRRFVAVVAVAMAVLMTVLAAPAGAQYSSGCAVDCLSGSPWVTPTPGGASFVFRTTVATVAEIRIAEAGAPWGQTPVVRYVTGYQRRSQHALSVTDLRGGHSYQYQVTVRDSASRTHREYGTFSTLQRRVEAHVEQVLVVDDSDSMGAGEISMHMRVGDYTRMYHYLNRSVSSGGILLPYWSRTQAATGDQTRIAVQLIDNDAECSLALPCDGLGSIHLHPNWGTGTNNNADWGTAGLFVDTGPSAPTGKVPFYLSSPSHSRIKFFVIGWYQVLE